MRVSASPVDFLLYPIIWETQAGGSSSFLRINFNMQFEVAAEGIQRNVQTFEPTILRHYSAVLRVSLRNVFMTRCDL